MKLAYRVRRIVFGAVLAAFVGFSAAVLADYPEDAQEPSLDELWEFIEAGEAARAERELQRLLEDQPDNADVLNLLGYANRKLERYDEARIYYTRALTRNPDHKGALEYMGQLELEVGDHDAAQALRSRLEALCPAGCDELEDLNAAFSAHGLQLTLAP